jgi:hypothetical protein
VTLSVEHHTAFLHRKLRKINLAVLHCLNKNKTRIGKQLPVGVAQFLQKTAVVFSKINWDLRGLKIANL